MSKRKRQYKLNIRLEKAYENYKQRYQTAKTKLTAKGFEMADTMLTRNEYEMVRTALVKSGVKTNINQTLVSQQTYEYSQKTAKHLKKFAKEHAKDLDIEGLKIESEDISGLSILDIRKGKGLSTYLADVNEKLKELKENDPDKYEELFKDLPESVRHTNQGFISYQVFGSN